MEQSHLRIKLERKPERVFDYYEPCTMTISVAAPKVAKESVSGDPLISCVLIAPLAVGKDQQGKSCGSILLADALSAFGRASSADSVMVAIDAFNAADAFCKAYSFVQPPDSLQLIFPNASAGVLGKDMSPSKTRISPEPNLQC